MKGKTIELPPCGIFVGSAVYNTCAGYLMGSGVAYTTWASDSISPLEIIDLTIQENQGNLIQFWWGSGGNAPVTKARYLALEDIGVTIPEPDWENELYLTVKDCPELARYSDRAGAGVLKSIRRCAEKGIWSMLLYCEANEEYSKQFQSAGKYYLGYDFGERFTFRFDEKFAGKGLVTLDRLAERFCAEVKAHVDERRASGWGNIIATSSNFYMDYEVAAGTDITLYEDCCMELNFMSALSRGLHRQYETPLWGAHIANEHYSWLPFSNPHRFETLRSEMFLKYLAGAKILVNESGSWHVQTTADNSPMNDTPRIPTVIGKTDPHLGAPLYEEVSKHFPNLDHNSPNARKYRAVISDFYDFVKKNGTPSGQPFTSLALVKGNYDLCSLSLNGYSPNHVIGGLYAQAEADPNWFEGAPERGWEIARKVFFPRPQGIYGTKDYNRLFSGTPYGQVDTVSFAFDQPDAFFLLKNYRALLFTGWNTCSEKQYGTLLNYVRDGGKLFISIPQLSTDVTRNIWQYTREDLVHGGDFSELCGVKVKGRGPRFYWATAPGTEKNCLGVDISRRYGVFFTCLGDLEILDPSIETLLFDHETLVPFLLRRKTGKGEVFFLNSWAYPGAYDLDYGPQSEPGGAGPIGDLYRYLARITRPEVYITGPDQENPSDECSYISYSWFPEHGEICLFNIDFEKEHRVWLHSTGGTRKEITLPPSGFLMQRANGEIVRDELG